MGLEVGTELSWDGDGDFWVYSVDNHEVSENSTIDYKQHVCVDDDTVESLIGTYFEYVNKVAAPKPVREYYISPKVYKAIHDESFPDRVVLVSTEKENIEVHRRLFDQLFKAIE